VCSRDAAETPCGAIDQEACKERLFTAKSRDYQKSQEGKERGERSRWWGNHHAYSPNAVRFLYSNLGFLVLYRTVPTLMPPGPSRPNTSDFIAQQLQILATMQAEQEQRERQQQKRKAQRPGGAARIPEVPAVPEIPP
jgi:hypothetical protein